MEMILYRKGEAFTVLYDECDHDLVSSHRWLISSDGYAITNIGGKPNFMHRMIMKTPKGLFTDHKNRIKHDNRRENLRICTKAENQRNIKLSKTSNSGYKGVYKNGRFFYASLKTNGKSIRLGSFDNAEDAAKAYDSGVAFYFGEFAVLNFSDQKPEVFTGPVVRQKREKKKVDTKEKKKEKIAKVKKPSDHLKRIISDDLSEVLKWKYTLKNQLTKGDIMKIAQKMRKTKNAIINWFKNDREFSKDSEYVAAIMDVISERKETYQQMIEKSIAA